MKQEKQRKFSIKWKDKYKDYKNKIKQGNKKIKYYSLERSRKVITQKCSTLLVIGKTAFKL